MSAPLFILKIERDIFSGLSSMIFLSALGHVVFLSSALLLSAFLPGRGMAPETFFKVSLASFPAPSSPPSGGAQGTIVASAPPVPKENPVVPPPARKKETIKMDGSKNKKKTPEKKKEAEEALSEGTRSEGRDSEEKNPMKPAGAGSSDAGLTGSIGGDGEGVSFGGGVDFEYAWYRSTIISKLKENWLKPVIPFAGEGGLQCVITFQILSDGKTSGVELESSSGYPSLDRSALRAVQDSSPFPPLPYQFGQPSLMAKFAFELKAEE